MRMKATILVVTLLACASGLWADAGATFYGDTTLGATYHRADGPGVLSGFATNVRYSVQPFFVDHDASCTIYSVQEGPDYDGFISLYEGGFDPANPLANLVAVSDDFSFSNGGFGIGTSRVLHYDATFVNDLYLVTSGFSNGDFGTFTTHVECGDPATRIIAGNGVLPAYDGRVAEVQNGRFQIYVSWRDFSSTTGFATAVPMGSTDSALFWFFQPANWEMLVKVIDGCGFNNRFWVFAAATTNVEFTLTVVDTKPNPDVIYQVFNPLGTSANTALTDTSAFATCP